MNLPEKYLDDLKTCSALGVDKMWNNPVQQLRLDAFPGTLSSEFPEIVKLATTFVANIERMSLLGRSPFLILLSGKRVARAEIFASLEIVKKPLIEHHDTGEDRARTFELQTKYLHGTEISPYELNYGLSP